MKERVVGLLAILCGVIWSGVPVPSASAEAMKLLDVNVTSYLVSSEWLPAGDEEGHVVGMGHREGDSVFSNGETAKYNSVFTFDARRGKGLTSTGYTKFTFADKSFFFISWTADSTRDTDGLLLSRGEGKIMKGTGRFEGIKGDTVFKGKEQKPASEDPKRTTIFNATISYTLP